MKKAKFVALSLVVASALSGIAYAAWTDTTSFNNTVNTGEFDISISDCVPAEKGIYYYDSDAEVNGVNDYDGSVANPDLEDVFGSTTGNAAITLTAFAKKVDVEVTNLFPGTYAKSKVAIDNNGTVPAAIENVKIEGLQLGNQNLGGKLWVEVEMEHLGQSLGKVECFLEDLEQELNDFYQAQNIRFDPSYKIVNGEVSTNGSDSGKITHTIKVGMNEAEHVWENDITEGQQYKFSIVYNWRQWNKNNNVWN